MASLAATWTGLQAQQPPAVAVSGGFSVPVFDEGNQLKYLVTGDTAKPVADTGRYEVTQFEIKFYGTNRVLELVAQVPDASTIFDETLATSPGKLRLHSAEGKLELEGRGLLWQRAEAVLVLSNDVQTLVRREFTGQTNAALPTVGAGAESVDLHVFSDRVAFGVESRLATYEGHVRVDDPEMELTSETLAAKLQPSGGSVERVEAKGNVRLVGKRDNSSASADRARYAEATDEVELEGDAVWKQGPREGRADRLVFRRREQEFRGAGHAQVTLPRETLAQTGFLLATAAATNSPATAGPRVQVFADQLLSRSNLTAFHDQVRVVDSTNQLTCDHLALEPVLEDGGDAVAIAEGQVKVQQGVARWVAAERAEYRHRDDSVIFSGRPHWSIDGREGTAETLVVHRKEGLIRASQHVHLVVPGGSAAGGLALLPEPSEAVAQATGQQAIALQADDLTIRSNLVTLLGNVCAGPLPAGKTPQRLICGTMHVRLLEDTPRIQQIIAQHEVRFVEGVPGGTNSPIAWRRLCCNSLTADLRPVTGELDTLVAEDRVVIEQPGVLATGARAVFRSATQRMELTGSPTLETPQGTIVDADALIWDRARNKFSATGGRFKGTFFLDARDTPGPLTPKGKRLQEDPR